MYVSEHFKGRFYMRGVLGSSHMLPLDKNAEHVMLIYL